MRYSVSCSYDEREASCRCAPNGLCLYVEDDGVDGSSLSHVYGLLIGTRASLDNLCCLGRIVHTWHFTIGNTLSHESDALVILVAWHLQLLSLIAIAIAIKGCCYRFLWRLAVLGLNGLTVDNTVWPIETVVAPDLVNLTSCPAIVLSIDVFSCEAVTTIRVVVLAVLRTLHGLAVGSRCVATKTIVLALGIAAVNNSRKVLFHFV